MGAARTHPQGLDDQVAGLQLSLHDTQQGEQLRLAQVIHVELTFLQQKEGKLTHQNLYSLLLSIIGLCIGPSILLTRPSTLVFAFSRI